MASVLLRSSALRGSAFRRATSAAAAAAAPTGAEGQAVRRALPLPPSPHFRLFSAVRGDGLYKRQDVEQLNLLHRSIKEMDVKLDKKYLVLATLQKLNEDKKPHNPFVQWSLQVGAVLLLLFVKRWTAKRHKGN